jgi:hypothetical protein
VNIKSKVNGYDHIVSHVVALASILEILAVPFVHAGDERHRAALARESGVLRALTDSPRAGGEELRARALGAITLAEKAVRAQLRHLAPEGSEPGASGATSSWLQRLFAGEHRAEPAYDAGSADDRAAARASGERLLATLAELRQNIRERVRV